MDFNWNSGASTNSSTANNKSQGGFNSNSNTSQSGFGGNNSGSQPSVTFNFASSSGGGGGSQQNQAAANGSNPMVALQDIADQYNPQSPNCPFQTVYKSLTQRSELCLSDHVKMQKELESNEDALRKLRDRMEVEIKPTIADLKQNEIQLSHRLLAVLRAVCRRTNRSAWESPLSEKELQMEAKMDRLSRESRELMARYSRIQRKVWDHLHVDGVAVSKKNMKRRPPASNEGLEPENMKQMFEFLKQQQSIIQLLDSTVKDDLKVLELFRIRRPGDENGRTGIVGHSPTEYRFGDVDDSGDGSNKDHKMSSGYVDDTGLWYPDCKMSGGQQSAFPNHASSGSGAGNKNKGGFGGCGGFGK